MGDIPVSALTDGCPRYEVERVRPARLRDDPLPATTGSDPNVALRALLGSVEVGSRRWVFRQYDHLVGSGTVVRPGGDAAVVRLTPSQRAIAVSLDGNGRRTSLDPRRGGMSAVCEAARNVACTGARPAAVTNCLNFGNPETSDVGYELAEAIEGMALACEALGLPVVSGNVSLYNEHHGRPIHPTPVVGVVGVLDDASLAVGAAFRAEGDIVLVAGDGPAAVDGSAYQRVVDGTTEGRIPEPDLAAERRLHELLAAAAERRLLAERARRVRRAESPSRSPSRPSSGRSASMRPTPATRSPRATAAPSSRSGPSTWRHSRSWPATWRCAGSAPSEASASSWPAPRSASPRRRRSTRAPSRGRSASEETA